jgi:hypothetical protein
MAIDRSIKATDDHLESLVGERKERRGYGCWSESSMSFDQADDDLGPLEDDEPLFGDGSRRQEEGEADERDEADSFYALLNVSKDATADEISKRYKALAGKIPASFPPGVSEFAS